jgi:hypothetical protein
MPAFLNILLKKESLKENIKYVRIVMIELLVQYYISKRLLSIKLGTGMIIDAQETLITTGKELPMVRHQSSYYSWWISYRLSKVSQDSKLPRR